MATPPLLMKLVPHRAEAIAAVHRSVPTRQERDHGIGAALGANCRMHFSGTAAAKTSLLSSTSAPALGTAPRLVGVPPGSEELLLSNGKGERRPTLHAGEVFV